MTKKKTTKPVGFDWTTVRPKLVKSLPKRPCVLLNLTQEAHDEFLRICDSHNVGMSSVLRKLMEEFVAYERGKS